MTTLADIRRYVNLVTVDDHPDFLIDSWARIGHRKVQTAAPWAWNYRDQIMTVVNSGDFLTHTELANTKRVISVTDPENGRLQEVSWQEAARRFYSQNAGPNTPTYYTAVADSTQSSSTIRLRLWPNNSVNRDNVLVESVASPASWPAANENPDNTPTELPEEFHDLVMIWALGEGHKYEGNTDLAAREYSSFMQQITAMKSQYVATGASKIRLGQPGDDTSYLASATNFDRFIF